MGPKELHIKAKFYTTCKAGNLDRPYVHKHLERAASVLIQLEFASMDSLIVQLMQVLEISKTSNLTERDRMLKVHSAPDGCSCYHAPGSGTVQRMCSGRAASTNAASALQEFSRQQAAACSFDYRRLTDEFRERILKECRARQVTPLIKQPGILVITDRGLYFQPLHNVAGGAVVKFHPAAAITSLARRRIAMRPSALEVFLTASASSHFVASDQVPPACVLHASCMPPACLAHYVMHAVGHSSRSRPAACGILVRRMLPCKCSSVPS